jgi:ectonucleotide pyrophosphatase/phosphodiesterase family member 5
MAPYMRNVFPTKTFPNHHSMATGVYADKHGVTGNQFYDFELRKVLNYSFEMFNYRSEIKPIWILNELAGGHSGCMMWPGSDYYHDGIACTHSRHYNQSENFIERVDEVMSWVLNKKYPANLVMFYIEEPDTHAHAFGPESQKITDLIERLDKATEYLNRKIYENNLTERVSVVHVSDHGMTSLQLKNVIDLRRIITEKVQYFGTTPVLQIVPDIASEREVIFQKLTNASLILKNFKVFRNEDLLERWHYKNKDRVGPLTVIAEINFGFHDMYDAAKFDEKAYNIPVNNENRYGVHGYDNLYETMHPIFFAYGHMIRNNTEVEPFDSIDLMFLFCEILGLTPPSYLMGNRQHILPILRNINGFEKLPRWIVLSK